MLGFGIGLTGGGAPLSAFDAAFATGTGREVGLSRYADGICVWSDLGQGRYIRAGLDAINGGQRMSWRKTSACRLRSVYPVRALTLTGGWGQLSSSGLGQNASYVGNRGIQSSSTAHAVDLSVDQPGPYDVWIAYTGRMSGGYARVEIDGAQDLVNEIDDPGGLGFKAFSTHTPTDMQRGRWQLVASGLTGAHDIRVSPGGAADPGGSNLLLEAIGLSAGLTAPNLFPPAWQPSTDYTIGDEVSLNGRIYVARQTATSDSGNGPTHTSGQASDGTMQWRAEAESTYQEVVRLDYQSEREYAVRVEAAGQSFEVGGQTHGNEPLVSRQITLDGSPWSETGPMMAISTGTLIEIMERTDWGGGTSPLVAQCQLDREYRPGRFLHRVNAVAEQQADFGWFYPGMMPLAIYDGASGVTPFETVESRDDTVTLSDYDGVNPGNANEEFGAVPAIVARGEVLGAALTYGARMSAGFEGSGAQAIPGAFLRPNLLGATASGSSTWEAKAYFPRAGSADPEAVEAGDQITFASEHVFRLREV